MDEIIAIKNTKLDGMYDLVRTGKYHDINEAFNKAVELLLEREAI